MPKIQDRVAEERVKRLKGSFTGWGTKCEIAFIRKIGLHRDGKPVTLDHSVRLLGGYIASLAMRVQWGNINKKEASKAATEGLKNLMRDHKENGDHL